MIRVFSVALMVLGGKPRASGDDPRRRMGVTQIVQ